MLRRNFVLFSAALSLSAQEVFGAVSNPKEFPILIKAGDQTWEGILYDNAAGRALKAMLPLKLDMMDLYGRELCYRFQDPLPTDHAVHCGYEVGEIVYWPPRHSFVILYAQNGEAFEMQKLGKITSPLKSLGGNDLTIEILSA